MIEVPDWVLLLLLLLPVATLCGGYWFGARMQREQTRIDLEAVIEMGDLWSTHIGHGTVRWRTVRRVLLQHLNPERPTR